MDFGMVGRVSPELRETMAGTFLALINKDFDKLIDQYLELGLVPEHVDIESFRKEFKADLSDFFEPLYGLALKEISVAVLNGVVWGGVAGLLTWLLYRETPNGVLLGFVMFLAMVLNMLVAAAVGLAVPMFLRASGRDPAIGGSVLLTFTTDSGDFSSSWDWQLFFCNRSGRTSETSFAHTTAI
jgi:hypothetical protein